jgi:signal transduction histidine kinase
VTGRRRRSLRVRITAGAVLVVLAALGTAGVVVVEVLEDEMLGQIDDSLDATLDFMQRALTAGEGLPTQEGPSDLYVQFLDAEGNVLGASDAAAGQPALARPEDSGTGVQAHDDPELGPVRVRAEPSPLAGTSTMVVAQSSADVVEVQDHLRRLLLVATLGLTTVLGVLIWLVVGRSLRPVAAMARTVDAMDDRRLTDRLRPPRTGDELDQLAGTLNGLLDRLDAAMARERRLVADASHELRTPIAGARALLESAGSDPVSARQARADALVALSHLQDLVDDLLVLARAGETPLPADQLSVDLDELVLGHARQLQRTTDLHIDVTRVSGGQVRGRDTDLGRVVENLGANAVRHASSRVAFAVRPTDGQVELVVEDDGPGIPEADRARVFERFTTLDDARTAGGTGLGLAIASAIVEAHGGTIVADGNNGHGARFVVRLPAAEGTLSRPTAALP